MRDAPSQPKASVLGRVGLSEISSILSVACPWRCCSGPVITAGHWLVIVVLWWIERSTSSLRLRSSWHEVPASGSNVQVRVQVLLTRDRTAQATTARDRQPREADGGPRRTMTARPRTPRTTCTRNWIIGGRQRHSSCTNKCQSQ